MSPAVLVELAAADAESPYASALLATCSTGIHSDQGCALAESVPPAQQGFAVAVVTWDDPRHEGVRVEVGIPMENKPQWSSRRLVFSGRDEEIERWRTVGFAIATLVGEWRPASPPPTDSSKESPLTPPPPQAAPVENPTRTEIRGVAPDGIASANTHALRDATRWWVDGEATIGPGVFGSPNLGGAARGAFRFGATPWQATASAQYRRQTSTDQGLTLEMASFSAGVGAHVRLSRHFVFDARAEGTVQQIRAGANDPMTGAAGSAARWIVGATQRIGLAWMWTDAFGLVVDATLSEVTGGSTFTIHGAQVMRIGPLDPTLGFGVRIALP